ncbi:transporter substrate-binding domain-containing protein [Ferrovibrio xuzhouensis]|uniref:Transporter substrate-binding domain-containing protein n=1 Tax=Ferrovibrio xuzhouensis TaxID=1576914 RepID=A0ABV7VLF3_9PROT
MNNVMSMLKKVAVAAAGALLIGGAAAHAQPAKSTWERIQETKVVRLAGTNSEFWAFKDTSGSDAPGAVKIGDTVWRGLGPVMASQIAEALGAKLEIVETTWGNAVPGLQAGQFDLIFGLDGTPPRAAAIDFVPQGLFWYGTALAAAPNVDVSSWEAINKQKLKVAVPAGTSMEFEIAKNAPNAELSKFQGFNDMIAAFQTGRVQALATSLTSATLISARLPGSQVKMPEPAALYPAGTGIRKETDPRWNNFLSTTLLYLVTHGQVQKAIGDVYRFRGVDLSKVQAVVTR